ncbi:hypothetical protein HNR77_004846 [Paenibacillus sp. JGP012]|uniref:hypothetical protein n=1 Tax=Paenibacillus sp. JGP012 TaxID=2735914 RepID=UPI001608D061|nr:hypothetical protein [Paenibacillus sp. JGP012]MBB6023744.1 hypothetical protein [Paenibacillus sp. JGP012]
MTAQAVCSLPDIAAMTAIIAKERCRRVIPVTASIQQHAAVGTTTCDEETFF